MFLQRGGAWGLSLSMMAGPALAAAPPSLNKIKVPDVNMLGLLDGDGPGFDPAEWEQITKPGNRIKLQKLGKAFFHEMQAGSDGIQACASCHYNSGADIRKVNSVSPGLPRGDFSHQLLGVNKTLKVSHYGGLNSPRGLPVSESAVIGAGGTPDQADGTPGNLVPLLNLNGIKGSDVNDIVGSQGMRAVTFQGLKQNEVREKGTLWEIDDGFDDNDDLFGGFGNLLEGILQVYTVRRVEPRNTPTTYNAIFNQSSFWDGRADMFFNGVNTLGFRDPDAKVTVYTGGSYAGELGVLIPFSSLASQAVGPIGSRLEMEFEGRGGSGLPSYNLGHKLLNAVPLWGQKVSCTDSLLSDMTDCGPGATEGTGLNVMYSDLIKEIFLEKFWGDGSYNDVCLEWPEFKKKLPLSSCTSDWNTKNRTLMEVNFGLFWGLAVQAYEATLTTGNTIVDLMAGGLIDPDPDGDHGPSTIVENTNGRVMTRLDIGKAKPAAGSPPQQFTRVNGRMVLLMDWTGMQPDGDLPLEDCAAMSALDKTDAGQLGGYKACAMKMAEFIHPKAETGTEAPKAPNQPESGPLAAGEPIGGCTPPYTSRVCEAAFATIQNIDEGMGRFQAGATDCAACHTSAEFTGATISGTIGFGAEDIPADPEEIPAILERMATFDNEGVYDSGFYNLAIRPTGEDLSIGGSIATSTGGIIPLSKARLAQLIGMLPGELPAPYSKEVIQKIADNLNAGIGKGGVQVPYRPDDLSARAFAMKLGCDPAANPVCDPNVAPTEIALRNAFFKTPSIRMTKFTGPYGHNGSRMNLRQMLEFYKRVVDFDLPDNQRFSFSNLNKANLDAGLRVFDVGADREAAMIEMMETGLTDWGAAYQQGKFDHPQICVPNGHDNSGRTKLANIPAVGMEGSANRIITFQEMLQGVTGLAHDMTQPCDMPHISNANGKSVVDIPLAP
ncbi:cytochrome c peroxidase [Microbulbifer sp. SA54]|uniref:cytochrome c peroxidase n=1 Tax=Microbulbifer sp. SA54 TaxID=3401577 RepID=UPI003AAB4E3E